MTTTHEFSPWPKTPRLFRNIIVTEKIDGTNAAVHISAVTYDTHFGFPADSYSVAVDGVRYVLTAQSRKRIITPDSDNYGFARWTYDNAAELVRLLGVGLHFGEWWGAGIQRRYGLNEKRFSLFNTDRHEDLFAYVGGAFVSAVPVLYRGTFSEKSIGLALNGLALRGSVAAPGFMQPEGICVWHSQTRTVFKVTLDGNDAGKWEARS